MFVCVYVQAFSPIGTGEAPFDAPERWKDCAQWSNSVQNVAEGNNTNY